MRTKPTRLNRQRHTTAKPGGEAEQEGARTAAAAPAALECICRTSAGGSSIQRGGE
ncbi:hypothetical protein KCP75_05070 [Salmonella enterica subsp. enterica]|nr:hypothetical protein KCP75_05070 [Salmonella enterica subsp. enterica]